MCLCTPTICGPMNGSGSILARGIHAPACRLRHLGSFQGPSLTLTVVPHSVHLRN
jgi:hypothetical protein